MKNIFSKTNVHGMLYYNAIYDYFDGPKLFSAIDARGKLHIVYWIDEDDEKLSWVIFPISKYRLSKLEKKVIDIFSALNEKEGDVFHITDTFFNRKETSDTLTYIGNINDKIVMPDNGLFISFIDKVITSAELKEITLQKETLTDYAIHVDKPAKKTKSKIDFKAALPSFFIVEEFYSEFLSFFKIQDKLYPVTGKPGSFTLEFNSDKFSLIEGALSRLFSLIKNRSDIITYIKNNNIPTQALEKLLNHIIDNDLIIDITNKHSDSEIIKLDKNDAEFYIKTVNKLTKLNVTSQQVPQADTLDKIFKMAININEHGFLNRETVDLSERHILYYLDACKILGFVSESNSITSIGQQIALSGPEQRLAIAAKCFESSHCGWSWIIWSQAKKLTDLSPSTAKDFLDECAPTLSYSTRDRRARTLRTWCEELKSHYQEW